MMAKMREMKGKGMKKMKKMEGEGMKKSRPAKGSPEAKEMMAKMRAMRGKKMEGGAMPPPSRSPVTEPTIGGGLY
jgi:hypothetical protein